jgi:hypothetical protein
MTPTPPGLPEPPSRRSRWVAIVTGALSIVVAILYLAFVTLLDSRGPLQPPPPEALADAFTAPVEAVTEAPAGVAAAPPPS